MKDDIRKAIIETMKWGIVLLIAGLIFYNVYPQYPKYTYVVGNQYLFRCDIFTGQTEIVRGNQHEG